MRAAILFQIVPGSGVPIYRQLMEQVRTLAISDRLPTGALLPSVRQVAEDLQVNPMTVSKAYSLLEREGVLEHVRGTGMRLTERPRRSLSERRDELLPLLQQVATRAFQLDLNAQQVLTLLKDVLDRQEKHRE